MSTDTIWFNKDLTATEINKRSENTLLPHIDIEVTEVGPNYVVGTMPVDKRTIQPAGILHGGASCVLAESLGSMAANFILDPSKQMAVGQSITASHIRPGLPGTTVTGKAIPIHIGRRSQVWDIEIVNEEGKLVCKSSLTMAIVNK